MFVRQKTRARIPCSIRTWSYGKYSYCTRPLDGGWCCVGSWIGRTREWISEHKARKHGFHLWLSSDDGHFIVAQLHPIDLAYAIPPLLSLSLFFLPSLLLLSFSLYIYICFLSLLWLCALVHSSLLPIPLPYSNLAKLTDHMGPLIIRWRTMNQPRPSIYTYIWIGMMLFGLHRPTTPSLELIEFHFPFLFFHFFLFYVYSVPSLM